MRTRTRAVGAVLVGIGAITTVLAPHAAAQSSLITFTTTSTGTRTVTTATAPTFPASTDLKLVSGDVATSVAASTTLTEVFASGATWSVKAQLCGPNDYTTPTAADCTNKANKLIRGTGGATDELAGSTISVSRGAITTTGLPAGTATAGSETTMGSQITLMTSTDEVSSTTYNGVYTTTTNLTINDLTKTGVWKGYWVVTQTT